MVSEAVNDAFKRKDGKGLNPCCSGGWSRRERLMLSICQYLSVLILVVLEDGLGGITLAMVQVPR